MENNLTFEKVWAMFQETDKKFQETDKKFQETDKQIKETDKQIRETEKQMKEVFREMARESRKVDKEIKELKNLFTGHWGRLIEALVDSALIELLQAHGIQANRTAQRVIGKYNGEEYEFDIVAVNGDAVVFVEVKTTLRPEDVRNFLEKLKFAREMFPEYRPFKIYGAMAYLHAVSESTKYAMNSGLFVIRVASKSAKMLNPEGFKPKEF